MSKNFRYRRLILACVAVLLLSGCEALLPIFPNPDPDPIEATPLPKRPTPAFTPSPDQPLDLSGLIREPVSAADRENERLVMTTDIPAGDYRALGIRYRGLPADTPDVACTAPQAYAVGDEETFIAFNNDSLEQFEVTATLIAQNDRAYMWLDNRWLTLVDRAALTRSAEVFATKTYDRNRSLFGPERSPGIDCEARIHILNLSGTSAGGYFWSVDQYTRVVRDDSNEKDVLYIDIEGSGGVENVGEAYYDGVIAHEFQHLILYAQDLNEDTWVSEGMSELAIFLNGDDPLVDAVAALRPDIQLNTWPKSETVYYGTAFSFMLYFWEQFGDRGVQLLAAEDANGLSGVENVLKELRPGQSANDFVAAWLIARLLDDPSIADGQYGYAQTDRAKVEVADTIDQFPYAANEVTPQYSGAYRRLSGDQPVTIEFAGSLKARMLDTTAHSGQFFWWSNRGDTTDLQLTREFDLTGVNAATLKYWTWYSLEKDWDYAYLSLSADGGRTWQIIRTPSGTDYDPVNANYGWGYTGNSGGEKAQWIQEVVDLNDFAGQKILVRFNVLNDLAVNEPGFAIDDVEVPEINYREDFEAGDGGWQGAGFLRTNNYVPQSYIVQLVSVTDSGQTTVTRLPLSQDNIGRWDVPLDQLRHATLVISPMALRTTEPANFNWSAIAR